MVAPAARKQTDRHQTHHVWAESSHSSTALTAMIGTGDPLVPCATALAGLRDKPPLLVFFVSWV